MDEQPTVACAGCDRDMPDDEANGTTLCDDCLNEELDRQGA